MIRSIDTLAYSNRFRSTSPMWKCAFAATMFLLAYLTHPLVQLILFVWMLIWTVGYAKIPLKPYSIMFGVACLFFLTSLPAMVVEFSLVHWTFYVNQESLWKSVIVLVRIMACLSSLFFIMFTTPFQELLLVLKRLRMPHLVLELMLIMYRFLFLLADTAYSMSVAQRARGGQTGFSNKMHDISILIVRLFIKTMQRYKGLSHGLISRGFTDDIQFAPYHAAPFPLRFKLEGCIGFVVLIALELWIRWGEM